MDCSHTVRTIPELKYLTIAFGLELERMPTPLKNKPLLNNKAELPSGEGRVIQFLLQNLPSMSFDSPDLLLPKNMGDDLF